MFRNNTLPRAEYYDEINSTSNLLQSNHSIPFKSSELTAITNIKDSKDMNSLFVDSSQSLLDALRELNHQRVSLVLEINALLLQKCIELQNAKNIEKDHLEAPESTMTGCIQRLQTNLAYLAAIADKSYKNNANHISF
ncbi:hypothetical protein PMAC_000100 [Pneumocystis sp. 'macacae']|nr:hypothetical protein PMAC_000100 [Pneumocystis sp. 'macacae']